MSKGNTVGSRIEALTPEQSAYIAGFLDGDGSIVSNFEHRKDTGLGYRVRIRVSFTQHQARREVLDVLCAWIGSGVIAEYEHNGMAEYVIRDQKIVEPLIQALKPFLIVKQTHAELAQRILALKRNRYTIATLERMRVLTIEMRSLNRYPKRINLDPVTTESKDEIGSPVA